MHADRDSSGSSLVYVGTSTSLGRHLDGEIRVFIRGPFSESVTIIQPKGAVCQRPTQQPKFPSHSKERVHVAYEHVSPFSLQPNISANIHLPINQNNTCHVNVLRKAKN